MEDDIDIEEHDVLDNPRIRTIFPDIAQIKAEIPDDNYNDPDPDQEMEYEPYSTEEHPAHRDEEASEYNRFDNKIILGSKPVEVKQEVEEYDGAVDEDLHEDHYNQQSTVLILGSKPSSSGVITPFSVNEARHQDNGHHNVTTFLGHEVDLNEANLNENEEEEISREPRDPSAAVVLVENWGPRLENSTCYCKECEILFPTSNTLLAHNMTAHSFLVALDKNKAVKSTSKPNAKMVETGKLCNHCNKMFPDSDTLINHLYMTFDKNALIKNQPKKVVSNPFNKQVNANLAKAQKRDVPKPSKTVSNVQVYAQGATDLFRCEVCSYYCEIYGVFVRHMNENHSKETFSLEKEIFNGTCPHCNMILKSKLVYNRHIQFKHSALYNHNANEMDELLYRCGICSYYVEMNWALVRHMKVNHGKKISLESIRQRKTAFDGQCPHCCSVMKKKINYNKHMKNVHSNWYNIKGVLPPNSQQIDKTPTPKKIPVIREENELTSKSNPAKLNYNSFKYQCQSCGEILKSYDKARYHRRHQHPKLKTVNLFKKISNVSKTNSVQKTKISSDNNTFVKNNIFLKTVTEQLDVLPSTSNSPQKNEHPDAISKPQNQIVIPKSVIFKCNKCDVHFTSCTATVLHSKIPCGKQNEDWKCNICNRLFQNFDQTVHKRQHQVSEKFNVIVFHENIYGRVLNRCPNCKLFFHEKEFYLHHQKKYCRGTGVKCEKCSAPIHVSSVEMHSEWHERIKNIKKNMVLVEFSSISTEKTPFTPAKRVLDMDNAAPPVPAKKPKIETPLKKTVIYCQKCGLYMFNSRHAAMHKIGKCKLIPNSSKKICRICGLTYKTHTHMLFHKTSPNVTIIDMKFQSVKDNSVIAPPIPNFYGCKKCKVHFCKKDAVVTHNCKDSYKTCKYCKKRYSDLAYKLHMKFHEYHAKFDATTSAAAAQRANEPRVPQKSETDPMPELLKKYEMLTNTWNILFLCSSCDIVCDNYDRVVEHCQKHFNNMESYDVMIQYCEICELKFDGSCFERHKALHAQNERVNKDSFTVCPYNHRHLLTFKWLESFHRVIPATQMKQILSKSIYIKTGRSIKLRVVKEGPPENSIYRCGLCKLFIHPQIVATHHRTVSCNKDSSMQRLFNCKYCGIPYSTLKAKLHHEENHKTAKSFNIVYFNENGDREFNEKLQENDFRYHKRVHKTGKGYYYYRCEKCKCCMIAKDKASVHECTKERFIEQCRKCHLHFSSKIFSRHMKLHEINPRLTAKSIKCIGFERGPNGVATFREYIKEKTVVKLYKCHCGLHFTSTKAIENHFELCGVNDDVIKEKCSKCNRLFDTNQLVTHLCKHHSKDNDKDTEFEVTVLSPEYTTKTEKSMPKAENKGGISKSDKRKNLFKCKRCNVCYLSQGGLAYHFERNHQVFKVKKCGYCKLQFMPMTLQKHIAIQHKTLKCKLNDFNMYIGYLCRGTLRVKKSSLAPKRVPCKQTEGSSAAVQNNHSNLDMALYNKKLYKCESCDIHLLTRCSLLSHRRRNNHDFELVKCPECSYSFSSNSFLRHQYIHHEQMNLKREDFKIKYALKSISRTDDSTDDETDCNETDNSLDEAEKLSDHIESSVTNNVSLQTSETSKSKNIAGQTKTYKNTSILYECGICNLIYFKSSVILHVKSHSTNEAMPELLTCTCGLNFSAVTIAKHQNLHHGIQNLTRDDLYTIKINFHDGIIGSNHLFRCEICFVNFSTINALENHLKSVEHNTPTKTCKECGLLFTSSGIGAHVKLHHNAMKIRPEDLIVLQSVGDSEVQFVDNLPINNDFTLTGSKKIIATKDRHLYKCFLCTTYYLNLDDLRLCKHEDTPTAVCEKCHLKFCKDALETHIETHHTGMNMKKEDFEIIESGKLLEEAPAFTNSSEIANTDDEILDDIQPDIDQKKYSILYKCNGCLQHFLHKKSLYTHLVRSAFIKCLDIETCNYCGLYFSPKTFKKHEKQHTSKKLSLKDFRIIDQVKAGFSEVTCTFPTKTDEIQTEKSEKESPNDVTQNKKTDNNDGLEKKVTVQIKNKLYQCDKCECCFLTFTNARNHYDVCQYVQDYVECEQCQLKFHKSLNMHTKLHHETQNLKLKDLVVIRYTYTPKLLTKFVENLSPIQLIENSETISTLNKELYTNKLFKCGTCSMHFFNKESLEIHTDNPQAKLPKSTCTFCGLVFSVNTLPTHIYIHHENMKLTTADFCITVMDEIMEQEKDCSIISESNALENSKNITSDNENFSYRENYESRNAVAELIELRDSSSTPDTALEVESSTSSANNPNEKVEYEPKIFDSCRDDTLGAGVQSLPKPDALKETEMSITVKLYKCAICNVCFLTQASCYRHTVKHVALDPKDYIECKLCGYQFLILNNCLHKHVTKHHKRPFKPEEVLIEEYHPDILCHGTPKINIYFGTDKLQSKLISTTSDANVSSEISDNGEVDLTTPGSSNPDLDLDTVNSIEKSVEHTEKIVIIDDERMDINSDIANVKCPDEKVDNSGNTSIDIDLNKNSETVSLDITDRSVDGSNNSIIDLDKISDIITLESDDEDSITNCKNIDENPDMVASVATNTNTINGSEIN